MVAETPTPSGIPADAIDRLQARQALAEGDAFLAEDACRRWLNRSPRSAEALTLLGRSLAQQQRLNLALHYVQQAWQQAPGADTACALAAVQAARGDADAAEAAWQQALVLGGETADEARFHLANSLFNRGDYESALPHYRRLLAENPADPERQLCLAKALHNSRRFDDAEAHYRAALATRPDDPAWRWEYAMQLLMTGRFTPGWEHYDARLDANDWMHSGLHLYPFPFPLWQGEDLRGKTLLLHGEQGLGDEIQFAGLVPELLGRGGRVILACSPPLQTLFARSFACDVVAHPRGPTAVAAWQQGQVPAFLKALGTVHYHCPLGSLPRYLRPDAASFQTTTSPYLCACPQKTAAWGQRLAARPGWAEAGLRIGLMWSGNRATGLMGRNKSIDLPLLAAISQRPGVVCLGLQNAEYGAELAQYPDLGIVDVSADIHSFDDTAALIANTDAVVSVDTSVAHLAAALGHPTHLLLAHGADWRWQATARDSPWYPGLRLHRQASPGDWTALLARLALAPGSA